MFQADALCGIVLISFCCEIFSEDTCRLWPSFKNCLYAVRRNRLSSSHTFHPRDRTYVKAILRRNIEEGLQISTIAFLIFKLIFSFDVRFVLRKIFDASRRKSEGFLNDQAAMFRSTRGGITNKYSIFATIDSPHTCRLVPEGG